MNLVEKLKPGHTALIVIDMQNDFCSPSGCMAKFGKDVSHMDTLVNKIKKLIDVCDEINIPTLFTQQIYDRSKLNPLQIEQYDLDGRMVTCDITGEGYKFYGFTPKSEQIYQKYNYNIFSNQKLHNYIEANHIKTLIITGVSTQICVETAIRNGFDLGYKIVVPKDLIGTTSNDSTIQERTLSIVRKTYGVVSDLDEVSSILKTYAQI